MSVVVRGFEDPDGIFDQQTADELVDFVNGKLDEIDLILTDEEMADLFDAIRTSVDTDSEQQRSTQDTVETDNGVIVIEGAAVAEVDRRCDGWGDTSRTDPANGSISLIATVTDIHVDPVLWATLDGCRYTKSGQRLEGTKGSRRDVGDIRIYVGEDVRLDALGEQPQIYDVDMNVAANDSEPGLIDVQFRVLSDPRRIEVLVPTSSGLLVAQTSERVVLSVRGANGEFVCEPTTGVCTNSEGAMVELPDSDT